MQETTTMQWALDILLDAMQNKMYGAITLKLENGCIVSAKTEQSLKPPIDTRKQ